MKFRNLVSESLMDDIPKQLKGLVGLFDIIKDDESTTWKARHSKIVNPTSDIILTESEKIAKVIEMTDIKDYQKIYDAYKIHKAINSGSYIVNGLDISDYKVINVLIMYYFNDNFRDKKIYESENGLWEVDLYNNLFDSIGEETYWLQTWQVAEDEPACAVENEIFSIVDNGNLYYDLLPKQETLDDYLYQTRKQRGEITSGTFQINPLNDLSDQSLYKYFNEMFVEIAKVIKDNEYILYEFKNNKK